MGKRGRRWCRGVSLVELLTAAFLIGLVATSAFATWGQASRAVVNKRATEMGLTLGTRELETRKDQSFATLALTSANSPVVAYYDRYGATAAAAAAQGYLTKTWITAIVDRNGVADTEDLREIRVEVWNSDGTRRYATCRTLLTYTESAGG
jgi:hypothetical protein